jgi:hypothetical protein
VTRHLNRLQLQTISASIQHGRQLERLQNPSHWIFHESLLLLRSRRFQEIPSITEQNLLKLGNAFQASAPLSRTNSLTYPILEPLPSLLTAYDPQGLRSRNHRSIKSTVDDSSIYDILTSYLYTKSQDFLLIPAIACNFVRDTTCAPSFASLVRSLPVRVIPCVYAPSKRTFLYTASSVKPGQIIIILSVLFHRSTAYRTCNT